jgi:cytoplasmic iron level regulating protein YaaA (DUF328/UPF0246 family)
MLIILSPSKTQHFADETSYTEYTRPKLLKDSQELVAVLEALSIQKLQTTLGVSPKLASLNYERFKNFSTPFTTKNSRQALLAFRGDVYQGFELDKYKKKDFQFAQEHLRILSGLYGVLKPLDLIQPYRLEMKTPLKTDRGANLYDFWEERIAHQLASSLPDKGKRIIINLASNEYSKAARLKSIDAEVITPVFKEKKGSDYKVVALFAKRARGSMANWIIRKSLKRPTALQKYTHDGYSFNSKLSTEDSLVFTRG